MLHPDLRLALMAGDETTVARVEGRQALGPRWVSHVLQAIVAELLRDPASTRSSTRARAAYARPPPGADRRARRARHAAHGRSGLNVWVPVREEAPVARALLDAGWLVIAGERFRIGTPPGIRVTTATLDEARGAAVAAVIAAVEHAGGPPRVLSELAVAELAGVGVAVVALRVKHPLHVGARLGERDRVDPHLVPVRVRVRTHRSTFASPPL